jgi:hypothetical protein
MWKATKMQIIALANLRFWFITMETSRNTHNARSWLRVMDFTVTSRGRHFDRLACGDGTGSSGDEKVDWRLMNAHTRGYG